jgi:sulfur carrier protein
MKLRINGEEQEYTGAPALPALLRELGLDPTAPGVAVAVNARVIPRREFEATPLAEGDRIEVVRAVQGG